MRLLTAGFAILGLGIETSTSITEFDLARYAITQGGLLIVVLVLLWSYRKDLTKLINRQDERIDVLTDLVGSNVAAMTRAAAASEANEKAAHRLSRALDNFEERRRVPRS